MKIPMIGMIGCGKCVYFFGKKFGYEVIPVTHGLTHIVVHKAIFPTMGVNKGEERVMLNNNPHAVENLCVQKKSAWKAIKNRGAECSNRLENLVNSWKTCGGLSCHLG